jgi:hypothetical protein
MDLRNDFPTNDEDVWSVTLRPPYRERKIVIKSRMNYTRVILTTALSVSAIAAIILFPVIPDELKTLGICIVAMFLFMFTHWLMVKKNHTASRWLYIWAVTILLLGGIFGVLSIHFAN